MKVGDRVIVEDYNPHGTIVDIVKPAWYNLWKPFYPYSIKLDTWGVIECNKYELTLIL